MCLYKTIEKAETISGYLSVSLIYSIWFYGAGGRKWFCRIFFESNGYIYMGQSYGKNKFDAYRKAQSDLNLKLKK